MTASARAIEAEQILDSFATRLIRRKAKSLIGKFGYTRSDREDLEQELTLDLLKRVPKFDPRRLSQHRFVASIVRNKIRLMVRARKRIKRRKLEGDESFDSLCNGAQVSHRGIVRQDPTHVWERTEDVQTVLAQLPPELRKIAQLLKEKSVSAVARDLGMTRKVLRMKLAEIREYFIAADIDHVF